MNRFIQYLNLLGIISLAALCCLQWRVNSRLNLEVLQLETTRQEQSIEIAQGKKLLNENAADLDDFRERLKLSESQLKRSEEKVAIESDQLKKLTNERDQLKAALDKWMAAVASRDEALQAEGEQLGKLQGERNEAVNRFNDLAGKYNDLVKNLNESSAKK
jgi:chromosome segregation ATPase